MQQKMEAKTIIATGYGAFCTTYVLAEFITGYYVISFGCAGLSKSYVGFNDYEEALKYFKNYTTPVVEIPASHVSVSQAPQQ